ncbi:MAG: ABC transporter permease [Halobacteriales archaeon]
MSLQRFILRRLLLVVPIMFGVSVITFGLVKLSPSDPVQILLGANPDLPGHVIESIRRRYGFDRPVYIQYLDWLSGVLVGDFGIEYSSRRDVGPILLRRIPPTIVLGLFGWVFALAIAIPTGIYAAVRKDKLGDHVSRFVALSGISIPNFWLGLLLILFGALILGMWDVVPPRSTLWHPEMLWYLILPGITIGTAASASMMRIMRSAMAEEMNKEYVTTARAKGLPERRVILKHVLRNSLISVVTVAAFLTAGILAGSVVVETVFNWPGLGRELVEAVIAREINLILAITLFTGIALVIANLLADIVYAILDPRIRY